MKGHDKVHSVALVVVKVTIKCILLPRWLCALAECFFGGDS